MSPSGPFLFSFLIRYATNSTKKASITPTTVNAVDTELPGLVVVGLAVGGGKGLAAGEAKGLAVGEAKGLADGEAKGLAVSCPMDAFVGLAVKVGSAEGWCSREG
jgi:hypothetical protein